MKTHAKDYINEFSKEAPLWLQELIDETLKINQVIDDQKLEYIYQILVDNKLPNDNSKEVSQTNVPAEIKNLKLIELSHKSGVNALKSDQTILFSSDCTLLYGLNGSGKSGYFRILNEIVGGNQEKKILPNIFLSTQDPIKVLLRYNVNGIDSSEQWDNTRRAISPLEKIRVFDSSYLLGYLKKRSSDEAIVSPLGLNLFLLIIEGIDNFKKKLNNAYQEVESKKPAIETISLSEDISNLFISNAFTKDKKLKIESLYVFSEENKELLASLKKEVDALKQNNIEDKIKLENIKKNKIEIIQNKLNDIKDSLDLCEDQIKTSLTAYTESKNANQKYKDSISALNSLPSTDTEQWKNFITAGQSYIELLEDNDEICIYCRQPLAEEALAIVHSYGVYLSNDSETILRKIENEITALSLKVTDISLIFDLDQETRDLFESQKEENTNLLLLFNNLIESIANEKKLMLQALEAKDINSNFNQLAYDKVVDRLQLLVDGYQKEIEKFNGDNGTKQARMLELADEINPLEENQSISIQSEQIKNWFILHEQAVKLEDLNKKINTKQLSNLSKTAHSELLSENLKTLFQEELGFLGLSNIEVKLKDAGTTKGVASTELEISDRNDISLILSEGEQKAIALALFISEIRIQNSNFPVIFDDPVNSLDHRIANSFAQRLLSLNNQTVVFTHNKLFLDAFETANSLAHVCKNMIPNGCNSQKKHIYLYMVSSEGKDAKGIIRRRNEENAKMFLDTTTDLLNVDPFDKDIDVSSNIRKVVECLVDEKVFNRQVPTRLSSKNGRIHWDELKKLDNNPTMIDKLRKIHDRVSGGALHNGTEANENPIDKAEFLQMVADLKTFLS
ncbi:hypothetical protein EHQ81_18865 [Leptospira selangorensis]|uniref:Protein CR006 P-loop domain-containing protein n=1 Tax=Leptospira selangorensis TaxID=2484982 RepID=A0A5F2BVF5_9LEPT|nr:AAA family ATPase [Leptospira selangorensis]TGM10690.1 hypothetical protein EHQ81_18865 [Leptospira selangorensis]TGM11021.1 hypothetical protein EHQ82_21385 [Leptospira selangorensis]